MIFIDKTYPSSIKSAYLNKDAFCNPNIRFCGYPLFFGEQADDEKYTNKLIDNSSIMVYNEYKILCKIHPVSC